jgi:hypothetical protein
MRAKRHTFLSNFTKLVQAENLKAPGVSQDRPPPRHEAVQSAQLAHGIDSGAQVEVIRISEKDLNPEFFENILGHSFNGRHGADRHEYRCFDFSVGSDQTPGASLFVRRLDAKLNRHYLEL